MNNPSMPARIAVILSDYMAGQSHAINVTTIPEIPKTIISMISNDLSFISSTLPVIILSLCITSEFFFGYLPFY